MSLNHSHLEFNRAPNVQQNRTQLERRAAVYGAQLAALRNETFIVRCQLDNPRNECRRKLLAIQLDVVDARTANIAALLVEVAS